jgi:hypothetical protein
VYDMSEMFAGAATFDQALEFDTRSVRSMPGMFHGARAYNNGGEPLVLLTRQVALMPLMFRESGLRQEATLSDMSRVRDVRGMFEACDAAAGCVTSRVSQHAEGLAEQRARIRVDPDLKVPEA